MEALPEKTSKEWEVRQGKVGNQVYWSPPLPLQSTAIWVACTMEMHYLTFLEARSPRSWLGWFILGAVRKNHAFLPASGGMLQSLVFLGL